VHRGSAKLADIQSTGAGIRFADLHGCGIR